MWLLQMHLKHLEVFEELERADRGYLGFPKALDKDLTSSKKPWNKTESLPWAINPLRGKKSSITHGNQQATSPIADQELIARVNDGKKLFRATKMQLNVESARKTI